MDDDIQESINEVKELTIENNKILRGIKRRSTFGLIITVFWWSILIGASVGAFYYLQPYFDQVLKMYDSLKQTEKKITDIPKSFSLDSLKQYLPKDLK